MAHCSGLFKPSTNDPLVGGAKVINAKAVNQEIHGGIKKQNGSNTHVLCQTLCAETSPFY